jgi:hypothetical protein
MEEEGRLLPNLMTSILLGAPNSRRRRRRRRLILKINENWLIQKGRRCRVQN